MEKNFGKPKLKHVQFEFLNEFVQPILLSIDILQVKSQWFCASHTFVHFAKREPVS